MSRPAATLQDLSADVGDALKRSRKALKGASPAARSAALSDLSATASAAAQRACELLANTQSVMTQETDLTAQAAKLASQIRAAKADLNAALLAGADTAPLRGQIEALEQQAASVSQQIDASRSSRAASISEAIGRRSNILAAASARDLAQRIAALQPPPAPGAA